MNNIDILEDLLSIQKQYIEDKDYQKEHNINEQVIDYAKMWTKATETLIAENKKLKEENLELLTRLRADGLIDRDKYWINKIKEAIYKGTLEAKGWDCEDGAYCVEKEFQKLLGKE